MTFKLSCLTHGINPLLNLALVLKECLYPLSRETIGENSQIDGPIIELVEVCRKTRKEVMKSSGKKTGISGASESSVA